MNPLAFRVALIAAGTLFFATTTTATEKPIEVSFDFVHQAILVQMKTNGRSLNAMLDTGVDPSGIDLKTAKEMGLKVSKEGAPASGGGTEQNLVYQTR